MLWIKSTCLRVLVLVCGAALLTLPAEAETVTARYSVSLVGFPIGEADAHGSIEHANYKIGLSARLTGVASLIVHLRMALRSSGEIRRGVILPSAYATTSANSHMVRTVRMSLRDGTVKAVDISPPFHDMAGRVPVTAANKRHVLDPMSALIMAVPRNKPLVGPAACDRTVPVYDGVVRFNVSMRYLRTRQVAVKGYTGPVSVCAVRYTPIAGHKPNSRSTRFMEHNRDIVAWLAPIAPAHIVVPFRVRIKTMAGVAEVQATELDVQAGNETARRRR